MHSLRMTFHLPLVRCAMLSCAQRTMCLQTAQPRCKMVATLGDTTLCSSTSSMLLSTLSRMQTSARWVDALEESKKLFEAGACFVVAGGTKKPPTKLSNRGQLGNANDWKLLVDYEH